MVAPIRRLPTDLNLLWSAAAASGAFWSALRAVGDRDPAAGASAVLFATAAILFVLRRPPVADGGPPGALIPTAAALSPAAVALGGRIGEPLWHLPWAAILVVAGCLFAAWSLLTLGPSFTVLPALRPLVTHGPYGWVRHPAYLGELTAVLGLCLQGGTPAALAATVLAFRAVAARIGMEERILALDPAHGSYTRRVRHRLIPYLW
jgi:protein-S-isoprenylcysteine O-methyltransferase Ste14